MVSLSDHARVKLAILADDFTGACDAAAPFAGAGFRTLVALAPPAGWPNGVDVLSVDLDLRSADAAHAQLVMCAAASALREQARLFVKIDSTLRGPIAALVEGALEGSRAVHAVVAPAFPEQGRRYRAGRLGSDGASVHELLASLAHRCRIVDDPEEVEPVRGALLVGSGGLARRLAGPGVVPLPSLSGAVLVVAGSPAPATQAQLQRLPPSADVLRTPPSADRDTGQAAARLANAVRTRADRAPCPGLLVLTGGQTARLVCERLHVHSLEVLGEVQPGIPVGRLRGGVWDSVTVVTKAGGFGGPDALLDALRLLGPSCLGTP